MKEYKFYGYVNGELQRIRESERGRDTTSISYRWIYFVTIS